MSNIKQINIDGVQFLLTPKFEVSELKEGLKVSNGIEVSRIETVWKDTGSISTLEGDKWFFDELLIVVG